MWRAGVLALFACAGCNQIFGLGQTVAVDGPVIPGGSCGSDNSCGGLDICDTSTMQCVQCTADDTTACQGATPVCAADACRGCAEHSECASDVCLEDGSCAGAAAVAYVSASGSDPATGTPVCAQTSPCATVTAALEAGKPTIKVRGSINGSVAIGSGSISIVGDDDAELHGTGGPTVDIGPNATVTLRDLAISNGDPGIQAIGTNSTANVSILHSQVSHNVSFGVVVSPSGASAHPILTVAQSRIEANPFGGIQVLTSGGAVTFHIVGNVFFANGTAANSVGGASLTSTRVDNTLDFNTFVKNLTVFGSAAGIQCASSLVASNNIIVDNSDGSTGSQITPQTSGSCNYGFTFASPGMVPGGGGQPGGSNTFTAPVFKNIDNGDLHLLGTSAGITAANPNADLMGLAKDDPDGTPRHAPASVGAFQFH